MMKTRRKRRKPMSEINVVPYIDVMLVLLIVFMITAPLLTQGIKVELPQENSKPLTIDKDEISLVVSINAQGKYFLSLGDIAEQAQKSMTLTEVASKVEKILRQNPTVPILIEGDKSVNYGVLIKLMTVLENSGAKGIGLITQPPS